ncbi:winged helix-turn-helix domain-containing protein [Paraburkholderia sp. LEh10]|uniref:winged helix-turn-helix domain-containing protein n=1 Tax=Paraburkholderia sp. LEh10 TaxID=2821353 RepID=UPI001AE9B8CC|nr:winged helix-turn-helix domain-containing protein [Paraburkholderia sp. LEh10]MBP0588666.1 winged helix-turn-helix domain-containing protein [Paraburkholderia sp. LEh10]
MMTIKIGQLEISLDHREVRLDGRKVAIGSRAFDILALLIAADGGLVSRDDIMRGVWPTTVVEKNNLQVHISALRRAFGDERDRICTVPGRGYRLIMNDDGPPARCAPEQPGAADEDGNPAAEAGRPARQPLPARVPELVGRQDALSGIAAALRAHQTVTLVGTGGIGKTRLAVEIAHATQHEFVDGVVFVSLAAVHDAPSALDALAFATGSRLSASRAALAQIAGEWRDREALVVLDSCEQVLEIVAAISEALTGAGSRMRVLATSREALRVRDEIVYQVPPLAVPTPDDPCADVLNTPAVRFFLARAQADGAQFSLDEASLRLMSEVCRRLDGIPLALELAASRAAVLGIGLLATHLDDRLRILTGGRRTALPRHQTLKATLDWSYRLLSADEQKLLRWLGMFVNGFTLELACAMAGRAGLTRMEALDAVSGLVARSLLTTDLEGSSYRYRLLETTRAYAQQQLDDNGERAAAASAHAALFLELFETAQKQWAERPVVEWLGNFTRELGNLRTALDWTLGGGGDAVLGIALAALTVPYLFDLSLVEECCARARAALKLIAQSEDQQGRRVAAQVDVETRLRLVSALAAALVYTEGPLAETREAWTLVLNESVRAGCGSYASRARWGVWNWHQYAGRARDALMLARRFGDLARSTGNATHVVLAGRVEGIAQHYAGDQARARELLERMIEEYEEKPLNRWHTTGFRVDHGVVARATLARVLWVQGERGGAYDLASRCFDSAVQYDHEIVTCYVLVEALVPIALFNGEQAAARHGIDVLHELSTRFGLTIWSACCACYDAWLATLTAPGAAAIERLAASIAALRATGYLAQLSPLLGQLASALANDARHREALEAIDDALRHADDNGERWYYAQLCGIKGDVLHKLGRHDEAQRWLATARDWASRQRIARAGSSAATGTARAPLRVVPVQARAS